MTRSFLTPRILFGWLAVLVLLAARPSLAQFDLGANYTYVHSNVLPGCNCFSLNGGGGQAQLIVDRHWTWVADVTGTHRSGITQAGYDLTQLTATAGPRYFPTRPIFHVRPFGDLLLGFAHTGGSLSPGSTGEGRSNAFALQTGGGAQVRLTDRLTLVPVQVEYLLTAFGNGADNHQNDLRLSAGVLFRLHH